MCAATAAGLYASVPDAQKAMGCGFEKTYRPIAENAAEYDLLYDKYCRIGKFFEEESQ
jgi:L-ribulokinase